MKTETYKGAAQMRRFWQGHSLNMGMDITLMSGMGVLFCLITGVNTVEYDINECMDTDNVQMDQGTI